MYNVSYSKYYLKLGACFFNICAIINHFICMLSELSIR